MPNQVPESVLLQAVKMLIAILARPERAALRPWLLAKYQVDGSETQRLAGPGGR
jgi:hypothetical protein